MKIINLTQHAATPEQVAAGVEDLRGEALEALRMYLTFDALPSRLDIEAAAEGIATLAAALEYDAAMIGGAPWLMGPLEAALRRHGVKPLYAFSRREVVEAIQEDGSVRKTAIFRHCGFVEA
ncbi:MAG: hypothetical protein RBR77_04265 [Thauera sp.]|jgi:hypothetical protein|nr:hypothetical protein [Thauera sp.]